MNWFKKMTPEEAKTFQRSPKYWLINGILILLLGSPRFFEQYPALKKILIVADAWC